MPSLLALLFLVVVRLWTALAAAPVPPCADLSIPQLQGAGKTSPYAGQKDLRCVAGCVTGVAADGFYLQSLAPDADPNTSEGIFVYRWSGWTNPRQLQPGDLVEIRQFDVTEYYGSTEITGLHEGRGGPSSDSYRRVGACVLPAPAAISPYTGDDEPSAMYERYEGMRASMSLAGVVVGPTARYVSRLANGEPEIAIATDESDLTGGAHIFAGDEPGAGGINYLSGALGADLPDVGVGDRVRGELTGVLAYRFGAYTLLADEGTQEALHVEDAPDPLADVEPARDRAFALCTFNLENLFDNVNDKDGDMGDWAPNSANEYAALLARSGAAIREALPGCTVIALQEVEGKDAVWSALAAAVGPDMLYDYYESADPRDITVGILYDRRQVTLRRSEPAQACTPTDYEVSYATMAGPRSSPNPCAAGAFPLFTRPPYLAELTLRDASTGDPLDVTLVTAHFKSKRGDDEGTDALRVAQARHVAGLMRSPHTIALGDFNDDLGSDTLAQFAGFANLFETHVAPPDRYTYIYKGRAEVLDHVILTPDLDAHYLGGEAVHINADFPERLAPGRSIHHSSDHDPVQVRLALGPTGVSAATLGALSGAIGVDLRIERP